MSAYEKICTFRFSSGNNCEVLVNWETLYSDPYYALRVEWDTFPPSPEDCETWTREYHALMCRRPSELMPGGPIKIMAVNGYGEVTLIDPEGSFINALKDS